MSADRMRELVTKLQALGESRRGLARLLGYASDNSLRQIEEGIASISPERIRWLERYLVARRRLAAWLKENPPPP